MQAIITRFIFVFLMGLYTPTIMAVPVVAIDLDSGTAGIQSSLSVLSGTVLSGSLVGYDDGTGGAAIGGVTTDITSSDAGVASLGLTATAGSFAALFSIPVDASDFFTPIAASDILNPFVSATPAALGTVGYADLDFMTGGAFLPVGLGSFIDLINFSITAGSVGTSILSTTADSLVDLFGAVVFADVVTAELTVTSAGGGNNIPEPSILFLIALGLLGFSGRRFFGSEKAD